VIVPANPKLDIHSVVTPYTGTGSYVPGTAFTISTSIRGGTYQQVAFDLPPGNSVLYEIQQPNNGLQCGATVTFGLPTLVCSEKGTTPIGPGTFKFAFDLAHPVAPGTRSPGRVWESSVNVEFKYQW
jgi:hypothetical protein